MAIDLSQYGYPYSQDTSAQDPSDGHASGWVTWSPEVDAKFDGNESFSDIEFTTSDGVTSLEECAAKCQEVDAPWGGWSSKYDTCWCNFVEVKDLCREPCVPDAYIDFMSSPISEIPLCEKSVCHQDWFYDQAYCNEDVVFDEAACGATKVEELVGPPPQPPSSSRSSSQVCVLVKTGTNKGNNGRLNVIVDTSGEGSYVQASTNGKFYGLDSTVLDECYDALFGVQVENTNPNGWVGSVLFSMDEKQSYFPFTCDDCDGTISLTDPIQVDGDDGNGDQSMAQCLNGALCSLTAAVAETETIKSETTDQTASQTSTTSTTVPPPKTTVIEETTSTSTKPPEKSANAHSNALTEDTLVYETTLAPIFGKASKKSGPSTSKSGKGSKTVKASKDGGDGGSSKTSKSDEGSKQGKAEPI